MANLSGVNKYFSVAKEGFVTTTSAPVASGATTVQLTSVAGYSNGDTVVLVIDAGDVNKKQAFTGVVDTGGLQITNVVWTEGANTSHILGAPVIDYATASHQSMTTKGLLVSHNQDGTLKAGAVDNATVLASNVVETPKIKNANVTATKIDWASTGANAGIWWEELGRTTLSSAGNYITVSGLPNRKYLKVLANYSSTGGTTATYFRFNNDTGANYACRYAALGTSPATIDGSSGGIILQGVIAAVNFGVEGAIINIASKEKHITATGIDTSTTGASNIPTFITIAGKWANTSAAINRIDLQNIGGSGNFGVGSELVVLGHN